MDERHFNVIFDSMAYRDRLDPALTIASLSHTDPFGSARLFSEGLRASGITPEMVTEITDDGPRLSSIEEVVDSLDNIDPVRVTIRGFLHTTKRLDKGGQRVAAAICVIDLRDDPDPNFFDQTPFIVKPDDDSNLDIDEEFQRLVKRERLLMHSRRIGLTAMAIAGISGALGLDILARFIS